MLLVPDSGLKPKALAYQLAIEALSRKGRIYEALDVSKWARQVKPSLEIPFSTWNTLCWDGSLFGFAPRVMVWCEKAVQIAPEDPGARDSRGLARALTNDKPGAIEDFQFYVEQAKSNIDLREMVEKRMHWINELELGRNPFNAEMLRALRSNE